MPVTEDAGSAAWQRVTLSYHRTSPLNRPALGTNQTNRHHDPLRDGAWAVQHSYYRGAPLRSTMGG